MSPLVEPAVNLVEPAFYARAVADADLTSALGHDASDERVVLGREAEVFDVDEPGARHFPLLSYFGATGPDWGGGYGAVRVQCDLFVWPEGADGGIEKLQALDAALVGLYHRQSFRHDGRRFHCRETSWRRGGSELVLHRIREFRIGVGGPTP